MEALKFEVKIQKNGVIEIPEISQFVDQEAEVFIVLKSAPKVESNQGQGENFLKKWRGLLRDSDPEELKSAYLQDKHAL